MRIANKKWTVDKFRDNTGEYIGLEGFGQIVCDGEAISPVIGYDAAVQIATIHNKSMERTDENGTD